MLAVQTRHAEGPTPEKSGIEERFDSEP